MKAMISILRLGTALLLLTVFLPPTESAAGEAQRTSGETPSDATQPDALPDEGRTSASDTASLPAEIDVKKLGAKGDGLTDDIPAFEAAMKAIPAASEQVFEGVILVPPGKYHLSRPWLVTRKVLLTALSVSKHRLSGLTPSHSTF